MIIQFLTNGFITGILYSLLAIGFALVYNTTKVFHIAAAGLYVFAAYMLWWLHGIVPFGVAVVAAVLLTMVLSYGIDLLVYSPLKRKKASQNIALVASIGVMTVIVNTLALVFGNETKSLHTVLPKVYELGVLSFSEPQLIQLLVGGVVLSVYVLFFSRSQIGLRLQAVSEDDVFFSTLGYDGKRIRRFAFLMSGFFVALASVLNAVEVGMDVNMGMNVVITAIVAMIIGGTGKYSACILGGLTLGILQSLVLVHFSSNWQSAITFVVLLLFLFFRPQGLIGYKQRTV